MKPEEWIPERFTTKPELTLNKNAFVAWSIGKGARVLDPSPAYEYRD